MEPTAHSSDGNTFLASDYLLTHKHRLVVTTIIVVAIAFIITAISYFGSAHIAAKFHTLTNTTDVIVQANAFPVTSVLESKGGSVKNVVVPGQGTAMLVGEDMASSTNPYYLLMDPVSGTTNLYTQLSSDPKAGLVQQTNSKNQKIGLTVDQLSGRAAYLIAPIATTSIHSIPIIKPLTSSSTKDTEAEMVVWDPTTKKETSLGNGSDPMLLHGGQFILFSHDGELTTMQIQSKKEFPLAALHKGDVFGFDPETQSVALYYAVSSTTNIYSLAGISNLTYISSYKPKEPPLILVPFNGAFLGGVMQKDMVTLLDATDKTLFSFVSVASNVSAGAISIRHE